MNAYLAVTVAGMALSHSADTWSREFLVERPLGLLGEAAVRPKLQELLVGGSLVVGVECLYVGHEIGNFLSHMRLIVPVTEA